MAKKEISKGGDRLPVAEPTMSEEEKAAFIAEKQKRERTEARLEYIALHDPLTGLYNRAFFVQQVGATLSRWKADPDRVFAVLLMDLDRFKFINDSLGHSQGDLTLIEIAARLNECTRTHDVVARLGSDEFAMLIEDFDTGDEVTAIAGRIVEVIRQPINLTEQKVYSSVSAGIVYGNTAYEAAEEMLRDAGIAMGEAKRRNAGFVVFDGGIHLSATLFAQLGTELRRAVVQSEFYLEYQPIFDVAVRRICGVEALIRWQHPVRGRLYPGAFIQIAEETGVIRDIGGKMLREACLTMKHWQNRTPNPMFRLNFNISAHELTDINFVPKLKDVLGDTQLSPNLLQLEVTESVLLPNTGPVGEFIAEVKAIGVRVLLDDFGTAYSSLGYLDRYPIDGIKIDRSFVAGMQSRPRTKAIVKAVLDLAHALEMDTTAEGVESAAQLDMLQAMGCKNAQGFYLGKPVSAAAIAGLLDRADGRAAI